MFKLFVLAALVAVASAGVVSPYAYTGYPGYAAYNYAAAPLAYAAAPAYSYAAAPAISYAAAPVAYTAAAHIPAPVTYTTGYKVAHSVEPVEQHGYKIAY